VSTLTHELYLRLRQARGFLKECGWQRHTMGDAQDGYCITGAIRRTGLDGLHVVMRRMVALHIGDELVENFNDTKIINRFEAMQVLDFRPDVAMLAQAYGPHYEAVIGLVRQIAHLTQTQCDFVTHTCDPVTHEAQARALSAVKTHRETRRYVDAVMEDVRLALPSTGQQPGECWAVLDQVAVTQLAFDHLNLGALSISIDDVAPANAVFAGVIGLDA
jgi:hypothetical protein